MFIMLKSTPCPQCGEERILMYDNQKLLKCESDPYAGMKCSACEAKEILNQCGGNIYKALVEIRKRMLTLVQEANPCK